MLATTTKKAFDMMDSKLDPAIAVLQEDLTKLEQEVHGVKSAINLLCKRAGKAEMYPNLEFEDSATAITNIQADTFYGKTIGTAAREYLEMRRAANLGPASTREIFDALTEGGFKFGGKNEQNSMISLGQTLRKNSKTFHKLPNGLHGLLVWYPNAKEEKSSDDSDEAPKKSAASNKPTADDIFDGPPHNDQEDGGSREFR